MTAALELAVARQIGGFNLDVAFSAGAGTSVLFGPSGAGKSLTLALIAGLIRPDAGTISINGRVVTDCVHRTHVSPQDRRIGMVFQDRCGDHALTAAAPDGARLSVQPRWRAVSRQRVLRLWHR